MPLKGRYTPADRPRNELEEEEEETVQTRQYSQYQVHHYGTAARPNGEVNDDGEFGSVEEDGDGDGSILKQLLQDQLFIYPSSVTHRSWKRHEGVVRRSWRSCASRGPVTQVVGASYDGRAEVPSISREGVTHAEVVPCDRYTKYYKSHRAVCLFRSRRRHSVHGAPCDWDIKGARISDTKDNIQVR